MRETIAADEPFFRAHLWPHRSLGRTGFVILMTALGFGLLATSIIFLVDGAWPVFGFCALDMLGVYVAFRLNYRAARAREEVTLSRTLLDVRKFAPSGKAEAHSFNPVWTGFSVSRHSEIGITRMSVTSRNETVAIGSFLNPGDRESFATAFQRALAAAKGR